MRVSTEAQTRVLIADPVRENRGSLINALASSGIACVEASDGVSTWRRFRAENPDLILTALQLPGLPALDLVTRVRGISTTPIVVLVPAGEFDAAISAIRRGAADVIPFPCDVDALPRRIKAVIASNHNHRFAKSAFNEFAGRSAASSLIREQLGALAGLKIAVLFAGEKGTGRDHAARCLTGIDDIDLKDLIRCSPADAAGRSRGDTSKVVYVDDIDLHSRADQAYWAERILASERSEPGAPRRILASTTGNLSELSRRSEIDNRLADILLRFVVHIPPLRERLEDVVPIANNLVSRISRQIGRAGVRMTAPAAGILQKYSWPGNVSQLAAVIERLVAFAPNGMITRRMVSMVISESSQSIMSLRQIAQRRQREELVSVLDLASGNLAEAARRLGINRGAVIYRAHKFGLLAKRVGGGA